MIPASDFGTNRTSRDVRISVALLASADEVIE
jgi:hypothetical protein